MCRQVERSSSQYCVSTPSLIPNIQRVENSCHSQWDEVFCKMLTVVAEKVSGT